MLIAFRFGVVRALSTLALLALPMAPTTTWAQDTTLAAGRPIVLFVHGRNQAYKTGDQLEATWFGAFRDGLTKIGAQNSIRQSDYRLIRYEDIYESDATPTPACGDVEVSPADKLVHSHISESLAWQSATLGLNTGSASSADSSSAPSVLPSSEWKANRNLDFYTQTSKFSPEDKSYARDKANFLEAFRDAAARVIPAAFVERFVKDTSEYLEQGWKTCETDNRVITALKDAKRDSRPVILVAHSMGAMVTYRVMHKAHSVDPNFYGIGHFITLGSQLGWNRMPPWLIGSRADAPFAIPLTPANWTNIKGNNDPLGWLAKSNFRPVGTVHDIEDDTNGISVAHDIDRYLQRRTVATEIFGAWCKAHRAPAMPPRECQAVSSAADAARAAGIASSR